MVKNNHWARLTFDPIRDFVRHFVIRLTIECKDFMRKEFKQMMLSPAN